MLLYLLNLPPGSVFAFSGSFLHSRFSVVVEVVCPGLRTFSVEAACNECRFFASVKKRRLWQRFFEKACKVKPPNKEIFKSIVANTKTVISII